MKKEKWANRRVRLLVNPSIQLAYWKLILTTMFLTALLIFSSLYQFLDQLILKNSTLSYVQIGAFLDLFQQTSLFLLIAFPAMTIALLTWSLLISNRIAGPLYRLEKELDRIIQGGDFRTRIPVREKDSLKNLAGQVNQLLEKIERSQGSP